jgi:hypothetical protein
VADARPGPVRPVCGRSPRPAMSSHALLLRLFLSPSFFNVHVALQYLALYADHVGITYYIVRRLRDLPQEDVYDVWDFVWCDHSLYNIYII